ncbi:MAG: histidine--tRNA ligase [Methanobrevibacter boviskoreani]|uniref:histidine--tRNA ligase n=1 Tax=Methanobrevibacter boviskoreani TaxID=1348249 RepID=UPI000592E1A2|nr:histidine--tRNA ligase [Methanobrevibacter boviskoreani]MCI6775619.1 histidine--tRNA ligase [Methanobrevibacter boviskoreani]MCI6929954.1 histidine--tRNA ligase [Methanobrevibacter boviskoreani]MDD6256662.1 histidine--tRNA ligase [Methanobrevibacter boviskoreani]MDY5614300.1 histidine--tRNA ligase [Methanobrevibacter boviskoreani]
MEFTRPRGTRDFLFDEMKERKIVENTLREVFENYGYGEVKTPLFEELKLFTTKSGEEIIDQLYNFKDKSNRELALRPEITAAIARLYINELSKTAKPIKLYYYGSCFRYERPQKGRFRQFWQFGCELIGAKSPEGEAEVIAMANESIEKLGIDSAEIHINHLGIIRGLFAHYGIPDEKAREVMIVVDKGDKDLLKESLTGQDAIIDNKELGQILLKLIDMVGSSDIYEDIKRLVEPFDECLKPLTELKELITTLKSFGVENYKLNLGVARGLDYYIGIVFEIYVPELGSQKQVCGGGTYNLIKLFGGDDVVSTGFAFGFDRLMDGIEASGNLPEIGPKVDVYVAPISAETRQLSFNIAQRLRQEGIATEIDLSRKKFKKLLSYANNLGVKQTILVGTNDVQNKQVTVKNMETGNQELVNIKDIVDYIKENI